jgi:exodeoxyribonuclease VII large subunit
MTRITEGYRNAAKQYETAVQRCSPENQLMSKKQYAADLNVRLTEVFQRIFNSKRHRLELYAEKLNGLSPLNRISKGFAYVTDASGNSLNTVNQVKKDENITLIVSDGKIEAKVINTTGGISNGK